MYNVYNPMSTATNWQGIVPGLLTDTLRIRNISSLRCVTIKHTPEEGRLHSERQMQNSPFRAPAVLSVGGVVLLGLGSLSFLGQQ